MMAAAIVLASGSPRRLAILRAHGIEPLVIVPHIDETLPPVNSTTELEQEVCDLALVKARDVENRILQEPHLCVEVSHIIAADTVVYKDRILGKPTDAAEAIAMLEFLRNSTHQVFTGVAFIHFGSGDAFTLCDISTVTFGDYSQSDIEEYVRSGEPLDKAGAYALQGKWGAHVIKVEGDRENVIGLPWHRIAPLLRRLG